MKLELVTKDDLRIMTNEIIEEVKKLISPQVHQKEWLKSSEVMEILGCSPGTLQNLRVNGHLPFSKMGGTIYYSRKDVVSLLEKNKRSAA